MKTPIQQIIEMAKSSQDLCFKNYKSCKDKVLKKQFDAGVTSYTLVLMAAEKLLEEEKKQLIAMCAIGSGNAGIDAESVFETRYGTSKKVKKETV